MTQEEIKAFIKRVSYRGTLFCGQNKYGRWEIEGTFVRRNTVAKLVNQAYEAGKAENRELLAYAIQWLDTCAESFRQEGLYDHGKDIAATSSILAQKAGCGTRIVEEETE